MMIAHNPPLILASVSAARKEMLAGAGVGFTVQPADIDESSVIAELSRAKAPPEDIALKLAMEKALYIAVESGGESLVIGSDQILEYDGQLFEKAEDVTAARARLKTLRGKRHRLVSAVAIAKGGEILWSAHDTATLTMHDFDDEFLEHYLSAAGEDITACVGAYALEKTGSWLFSDIQGDVFTIMGMPLLPLLQHLRVTYNFKP